MTPHPIPHGRVLATPHGRVLAGTLVLCLLTGCGGSSKPADATPVAKQVAAALAAGNVSKLPTTGSATSAQADLTAIMSGMDGLHPQVTVGSINYQGSDTADVELKQSMPLGAKTWSFTSHAPLKYVDGAWKLAWQPSIVHPQVTSTLRLRHEREVPTRAAIVDTNGTTLVAPTQAYKVGLDKQNVVKSQWTAIATKLAKALGINVANYVKQVNAAGAQAFVPAITLRAGKVPSSVQSMAGVKQVEVELPLASSSTFAVGLLGTSGEATPEIIKASKNEVLAGDVVGLSGLQKRYDAQLRGTSGHTVQLLPRTGASSSPSPSTSASPSDQATPSTSSTPDDEGTVLFHDAAVDGTPLTLSLDTSLQTKAEKALASQTGVASLVVLKVGTGDILAAANSTAAQSNPDATYGRYAPGSTFKVVTSLALLRKGLTPTSTVPCTSTVTVGGRSFKNYSDFPSSKIGNITLTDSLANSCNTAFISQHSKVSPSDLAKAGASLGVGTDYNTGFASFFGSIPTSGDTVTAAADMIGQGTVEASPMAMAAVADSVASGKTVVPWLVSTVKPKSTATALSATEAKELQQMMKAVVTEGSGSVLSGLVTGAKTGTAEYGTATPPKTHAWMIAWNKQYAIAAMVEDGESGSATAGPIIKSFLNS